jgi:hypothetical protein
MSLISPMVSAAPMPRDPPDLQAEQLIDESNRSAPVDPFFL